MSKKTKKYVLGESQYDKLKEDINNLFSKRLTEEDAPRQYTPKQQKLMSVVDKFQDGIFDESHLENYMGGIENLFQKLEDEKILDYIDPFSKSWGDYENRLFYHFYSNDSSFVWKVVDKYLGGVEESGGKYYAILDADDLSDLFEVNWRSDVSKEAIESILSGEYGYDISYDVTDNEYRDVYEELTNENKNIVNNRIREELKSLKEMDVTSKTPSLFDEIAGEQNREGDIELTDEVINRLINDENCVEYLINEMDDIRRDLYSLYSGCYDGVLKDSWYYDIMNDLKGYIIDDSKRYSYTYTKTVYDKEGNPVKKTMYGDKYEATNCIYEAVSDWIVSHKNDTSETIGYFGSYKGIFDNLIYNGDREKLRTPRLDDYPDHRQVIKCCNENIRDYF